MAALHYIVIDTLFWFMKRCLLPYFMFNITEWIVGHFDGLNLSDYNQGSVPDSSLMPVGSLEMQTKWSWADLSLIALARF